MNRRSFLSTLGRLTCAGAVFVGIVYVVMELAGITPPAPFWPSLVAVLTWANVWAASHG